MHLTYITNFKYFDKDESSGTPYWIVKSLEQEKIQLHNIHLTMTEKFLPPLEELTFRYKQLWNKLFKKKLLIPDYYSHQARHIANRVEKYISQLKTDAILTSLSPLSGAFLKTKIPIIYWSDAVYAALVNFYPKYRFQHPNSMWDGHEIMNACLKNAKLLIFSSEWAARTAVEFYGISTNKIKVVPFGANLDITHTLADVKKIIKARSRSCIKLLFIGKEWYRKGGDIALSVTEELHKSGNKVELTIVGCESPQRLPPYAKRLGFLSKNNPQDLETLIGLYKESHFLILPTTADCCPVVFAEANAFGLPCITTYVGGITTAVKDNINGMTFSLEATPKQYCDYIINLMDNYAKYESLSLSTYNEYETRLNWKTASQQVKSLIMEII